jgi:6,7-dimethyl-8-ribityllumazine synthase
VKEIAGVFDASKLKLGMVVSRFNSTITEKLLEGAIDVFVRYGGNRDNLTVLRVPGSFEIPSGAQKLASTSNFDAIVCIGCLIRGETGHFDYLASEVTRGIDEVALKYGLPVTYGVITSDTVEQAQNRAGIKYGNKGVDATVAAIEMANAFQQVKGE